MEARPVAPALTHALETFELVQEADRALQQLRAKRDNIKTDLIAVSGELEVLAAHQQLEQQVAALERERQERMEGLRKELETRLQEELSQTRQQIVAEQEQDFNRQVQAFEERQGELIARSLDEQLQLKEREIEQLSQEIGAQTQGLLQQLGQLKADSAVATSIEHSMTQAIAQRKAEVLARRQQLDSQGAELLARRRDEFIDKLKQQQAVDLQRRLTLKEAGLRQAMAQLLHETQVQETDHITRVSQALEDVKRRQAEFIQRQASLSDRLQEFETRLTVGQQRIDELEQARGESLARLEDAFQKVNPGVSLAALAWFGRLIHEVPPELGIEFGMIQQRASARAQQEQEFEEQRRVHRERQLALELSHEMERRYQEAQLQKQREEQARSKKVEGLLTKAKDLASQGRFDQALEVVAQAQTQNPPKPSLVALVKEDIETAKEQALRAAEANELERLFARAQQAFQQGQYEEAIGLFEQVISKEAALEGSSKAPSAAAYEPPGTFIREALPDP